MKDVLGLIKRDVFGCLFYYSKETILRQYAWERLVVCLPQEASYHLINVNASSPRNTYM